MSIRYRLFKIPVNINEVADRTQKTDEIPTMYAKRKQKGTLIPGAQTFSYEIGVKFGKLKVPLCGWERTFENFVPELDNNRGDFLNSDNYAHIMSLKTANELNSRGVTVKLGDCIYCASQRYSSPASFLSVSTLPSEPGFGGLVC